MQSLTKLKLNPINLKNIIWIVQTVCCIGGCYMSRSKICDLAADYKERLDSLPELSTPQQIQEALEAPEPKLYVISGYKFPKYEPYADRYVYYFQETYERDKESKSLGRQYEFSYSTEKFGKLFVDQSTELTDINSAFVGGCTSTSEEDYHHNYKYKREYLQGDEPLWATALIGNHTAKCEGIDGADGSIAGKSKDYLQGNVNYESYMVIQIVSLIGAMVFFCVLLYSLSTQKKQQRKKRRKKK